MLVGDAVHAIETLLHPRTRRNHKNDPKALTWPSILTVRRPTPVIYIRPGGTAVLEPVDWLQVLLGGSLFLLPGAVWTQVLAPSLPWPHKVPVAVVFAFTFSPAVVFFLHLFLLVPLSLAVHVFMGATLSVLGLGLLAKRAARS